MITTYLPDLAGDEGVLAEIPNIEVKSIEFRLFLTNKRLILIEDKDRRKAPVIVPLQVVRSVSGGKNFADDPVLKLSLSAPDGSQKKMVLSFTQEFAGIRDKERDQLKKVLEGVISDCQMTVRNAPKPASFGFSAEAQGYPGQPGTFGKSGGLGQAPVISPGAPILTAANIVVKSQEFTASLTNEKITLTDPNRPNKPSSIPLGSVRSAEGESGEQGEPAIALLVEAQNGSIRRMVLKFSQWYDKNRWGERETWVRAIQDILATGSVESLYRPTGAECAPQTGVIPPEGGFSAKPPGFGDNSCVCPKCGNPVSSGLKFCGFCGSPVGQSYSARTPVHGNPGLSGSAGGIIDSEPYGRDEGSFDDGFYAPAPVKRRSHQKRVRVKKTPKRRKPAGDDIFGKREGAPLFDEKSVAGRIVGFITSPARAFQNTRGQDAVDAIAPFIISLLIFALGNILFLNWYAKSLSPETYPVFSSFAEFGTIFLFTVEIVLLFSVLTLIYGALLHFSVGILGFRSEINDGIRIAMYSCTAFIAGGVIPVAGIFIVPFWVFILQITGLKETYDLSLTQAFIAALIPAFIALVGFYVFISSGESSFAIFGSD
ncbi:MAG: YIP1 family protein [Methanomicrobiaceae archaeon]|nr:YIP1 family protein [Methanomicrobiaceae archaeon]